MDVIGHIPARVVGVDYGTKRVGIALADPLRMFAQPYGTFSPAEAEQVLFRLYEEHGLATIVVGWPVLPDGTEGAATAFVRPFIERLRELFPSVEIVQWDELFTSQIAERAIRESGARRKARRDKARVDAAAAAVILQEYLDSTGGAL